MHTAQPVTKEPVRKKQDREHKVLTSSFSAR
jgi:hypothetical protein